MRQHFPEGALRCRLSARGRQLESSWDMMIVKVDDCELADHGFGSFVAGFRTGPLTRQRPPRCVSNGSAAATKRPNWRTIGRCRHHYRMMIHMLQYAYERDTDSAIRASTISISRTTN